MSGKIGYGKTSVMHLLKPFIHPKFDYKIKTCREVSFEFAKNGFEALQPFSKNAQTNPPSWILFRCLRCRTTNQMFWK